MDQPDREVEPHFSQPLRQIILMLGIVGLVGFGAYLAYPVVGPIFMANIWLNGVILFVFVIGVLACFWQLYQLVASITWIKRVTSHRLDIDHSKPSRLMAPLAALLRARGERMQIGASSARSILDSVAMRIDELREITRYITNLLIFLGLLGTFYGLATTIPGLIDTMQSLAPQEGEGGVEVFSRLMSGLTTQLGGMGTAFSSSLLGLAGSLVVGLLEIFAGHGQNRFYRELEEWLSTITRFGFSSGDAMAVTVGDEEANQGISEAALVQMAQHIRALQNMFVQSEANRQSLEEKLGSMVQSLSGLSQKLEQEVQEEAKMSATLARMAEGQAALLAHLEERGADDSAQMDAESRMRLRSIDVQLLRILEEISAGRQESMIDLRGDLAALTRAIRHLAPEGDDHVGGRGG